ncbi:MAG: riboflavin synthase [Candidatus Eremiobacteraeota bacterium]|nr:riboflavin synthase [Candidatus Eremiobacteraeota bacterium]
MFSGLIATLGTVHAADVPPEGGIALRVACDPSFAKEIAPMDSIAVNGVCLTATHVSGNVVSFDVVPETLARSTLGKLAVGERVNFELSLRFGDRVGGHFVYGHVDATARILSRAPEGQGERVTIECPTTLARMVCEKAFVSIDGVSLTVASVGPGRFDLALVPETLARTTLGDRPAGSYVNIEVDPFARYAVAAVDGQNSAHTQAELEWAFEI